MVINMVDEGGDAKRIVIPEDDLMSIDREALVKMWIKQEKYINFLEQKHLSEVKELESKLQIALNDVQRKEDLMLMRLNAKEQELQDYMNQISEMKSSSANSAVRMLLLDPAVNFVIEKLKRELSGTKAKLEETQSELSAWKFTPDSQTGKRLMAKCRLLHQENEDLGKVVASGKLAKLETELALQRKLAEEMKKSQSEMDEFVQELDEDVEGMQSTILFLQQQLREAKAQSSAAPSTNGGGPGQTQPSATTEINGHAELGAETETESKLESSRQPPEPETGGTEERQPEADLESEAKVEREARRQAREVTDEREVKPEPDLPEPAPTAEEPTGRRRRRRPEPVPSPEPRTKRRAAVPEESPSRRAKRTRSSDESGVSAE